MSDFPLIWSDDLDAPLAWRNGQAISRRQYLADVHAVASLLPPVGPMLNATLDRYRFAVGLGAAMLRGQVNLLPPNHTFETVARLRGLFPDCYALSDDPRRRVDLPMVWQDPAPADLTLVATCAEPIRLDAQALAAQVLTSGSTGAPMPHAKRWGLLVRNTQAGAQRLAHQMGRADLTGVTLVATVPPQHMYGFETTVLLPLMNGHAFYAGRPFFPVDVARSLAAASAPRMLVTTPVHLRAICAHPQPMAALAHVISATAPLDAALATLAETYFRALLSEVYGCTEAGQVATRRTLDGEIWQTYADVQIHPNSDGTATVSGGHVETPVILSDFVRVEDSTHFALLGRTADMINIAGKRVSLAYLNHHLLMIEGVKDGSFFWPDHNEAETLQRLVAFVVAPELDRAQLRAALAPIVDPAFMPRPIFWLDQLPRNSTGKLTRALLQALYEARRNTAAKQG